MRALTAALKALRHPKSGPSLRGWEIGAALPPARARSSHATRQTKSCSKPTFTRTAPAKFENCRASAAKAAMKQEADGTAKAVPFHKSIQTVGWRRFPAHFGSHGCGRRERRTEFPTSGALSAVTKFGRPSGVCVVIPSAAKAAYRKASLDRSA